MAGGPGLPLEGELPELEESSDWRGVSEVGGLSGVGWERVRLKDWKLRLGVTNGGDDIPAPAAICNYHHHSQLTTD